MPDRMTETQLFLVTLEVLLQSTIQLVEGTLEGNARFSDKRFLRLNASSYHDRREVLAHYTTRNSLLDLIRDSQRLEINGRFTIRDGSGWTLFADV